jgi:hypothetical protein
MDAIPYTRRGYAVAPGDPAVVHVRHARHALTFQRTTVRGLERLLGGRQAEACPTCFDGPPSLDEVFTLMPLLTEERMAEMTADVKAWAVAAVPPGELELAPDEEPAPRRRRAPRIRIEAPPVEEAPPAHEELPDPTDPADGAELPFAESALYVEPTFAEPETEPTSDE